MVDSRERETEASGMAETPPPTPTGLQKANRRARMLLLSQWDHAVVHWCAPCWEASLPSHRAQHGLQAAGPHFVSHYPVRLGKKAVECTEPPGLASGRPMLLSLTSEQALVLWLLDPNHSLVRRLLLVRHHGI
ncbi:hypothetical protein P7K49_008387 [Saguinus oedipus]|uniref:Uncharacterized protein n=1 Tax=Saguinus oedipus TaxID=9490 RepID=A0ABQ9VXL0_SAGOE|nr:hypothetical protein P7K49_008387 [Saguinus oedipus]